jgi:hypothetical protein
MRRLEPSCCCVVGPLRDILLGFFFWEGRCAERVRGCSCLVVVFCAKFGGFWCRGDVGARDACDAETDGVMEGAGRGRGCAERKGTLVEYPRQWCQLATSWRRV